MPRSSSSSLSDDETLYCTETDIANIECDTCGADDTNSAMFKQHVETFEKECCEELSDYDDWAPDEKIPTRKLKGTRLVDADIDLWRMRKTEHHAGYNTTPKKRARARSFREKRVALLSQATVSSDSEWHADDESEGIPSTKPMSPELEERELVRMVQADEDIRGPDNSLTIVSQCIYSKFELTLAE